MLSNDEVNQLVQSIVNAAIPPNAREPGTNSLIRACIHNAQTMARRKAQPKQGEMLMETRSMTSGKDYRPIVVITWNEQEGQLSPGEARDFAERVRLTADAAESDAFLVHFLTTKMGIDINSATRVLYDFREFREERARLDYLPPETHQKTS